jgi:hypothetical protein
MIYGRKCQHQIQSIGGLLMSPQSNVAHAQKTYKASDNTKNITNKACIVTKHDKLALFAQYCYSDSGSFGANHLHIERLIQKLSSRGTGDQRANSVLSKLTTPFGRAATAAVAAISLIATPLAANAQDNTASNTSMVSTQQSAAVAITSEAEQQVWQDALEHSRNNVELVIVVYGRTEKYTPEQLGSGFQKVLNDRQGVSETSVWSANPEQKGARVMFFVDGALTSDNILDLKEVMPHIPKAADMFKEHAPTMRRRLASLDGTTSLALFDVNPD